mgnify:CR=1 FL=1
MLKLNKFLKYPYICSITSIIGVTSFLYYDNTKRLDIDKEIIIKKFKDHYKKIGAFIIGGGLYTIGSYYLLYKYFKFD